MSVKQEKRLRRARPVRFKIQGKRIARLTVHRTPRHIYAQIILIDGSVVASASTLDKEVKAECSGYTGNVDAAKIVGKHIALRAVKAGVTKIAFDRSGNKYHGRIKALADAARENGLKF